MARTRNIKPGFFTNDDLGECQPLARLLYAGLWCHADRDGRLEDRPKKLKVEILPWDECNVDHLLDELVSAGQIIRYEVESVRYIAIPTFGDHQKPHANEVAGEIPEPPKAKASRKKAVPKHNLGSAKNNQGGAEQPLGDDQSGLIPSALSLTPISVPTERAQAPSLSNPPFALTPEEAPKPAKPSESPLDVNAKLWAAGKAYLAKHYPTKDVGAMIGKWRRDHGPGAVMDALAKAAAESASNPIPFIETILRGSHGKRTVKPDSHAAVRAAHAAASGGRSAEPGYLDPFAPVGPGPEGGTGDGQPVVDLAPADFRSVDHGSTGGAGARVLGGRGPDGLDGEVQGLSGGAARVPARLAG